MESPACGSSSVSRRLSPRRPVTYQAVTGALTLKPAGPARWAARMPSCSRPGYVAAISSACSRAPWPRSRSKSESRRNGQTPTRTEPIRASMPWRRAVDSIRSRTASSSLGLRKTMRLTMSAAANAAASHHRRARVPNATIDAGCHSPLTNALPRAEPADFHQGRVVRVDGVHELAFGFQEGLPGLRLLAELPLRAAERQQREPRDVGIGQVALHAPGCIENHARVVRGCRGVAGMQRGFRAAEAHEQA